MDYKAFVTMMKFYANIPQILKDLKEQREDIVYIFYGVHGVAFDRIPSSQNPGMDAIKREQFDRKIKPLDMKIAYYEKMLEMVKNDADPILAALPKDVRKMVQMKFIKGMTFYEIGDKLGYSYNAIYKKIKNEVEKL